METQTKINIGIIMLFVIIGGIGVSALDTLKIKDYIANSLSGLYNHEISLDDININPTPDMKISSNHIMSEFRYNNQTVKLIMSKDKYKEIENAK